jgi:hypothetical protein
MLERKREERNLDKELDNPNKVGVNSFPKSSCSLEWHIFISSFKATSLIL